ncbi:C2H2 finger domain protein [Xylaria arbuscula]|nr:C2H2 finger domain protein [Xylaria arbuscula]
MHLWTTILRSQQAIANLCKVHDLSSEPRQNRPMTLEDLKLQLDTTLRTTEKNFKLGEQRIFAVLFLLLLAPAGARPASILQLRFGDIQVALRRNPNDPINGPKRLLIRFTLAFTKTYLGSKALKTFYLPEMIYEPSFLLNPHAFLFAILIQNQAFRSEGLNSDPGILEKATIHDGEQEICLPLKKSLRDVPVFRTVEQQGIRGWCMSKDPINPSTMSGWVKRIGELCGFEKNTICYSLRYMAGNNLDQSVNVSDALRNLILDYAPNSDTFQKHYLSRNVCADLWAVHMDRVPQHALLQEAVSHGSSRSSRRPVALTAEQSQSINEMPKIVRLAEKLRGLRRRTLEYGAARRALDAAKNKASKDLLATIRQEWTEKQGVEDINRQIRGEGFAPVENRITRPMSSQQRWLVEAITASLICDLPTQRHRRTEVIRAIVSYCSVEEAFATGVVKSAPPPPPPVEVQEPDPIQSLRQSVIVKSENEKLLRCFVCVGKALLTLSLDDSKMNNYCRHFYSTTDLTRHFRRTHLSKLEPNDKTECPICYRFALINKKHLQRHAQDVHGIWI